jgi:cytochrome P450
MSREEHKALGERFRVGPPVVWSEAFGGVWYAHGHEVCARIAQDFENFGNEEGIIIPKFEQPVLMLPTQSNPPEHSFYRNAVFDYLKPGNIKKYEGSVRKIIVEALSTLVERGGGDAVNDFAEKVPALVTAVVLGFQQEQTYQFVQCFKEIFAGTVTSDGSRVKSAIEAFFQLVLKKYEEARANPGEGIASHLLKYEKNGHRLEVQELLGLLWTTAAGAVDTTKAAISHAVYHLGVDRPARQILIKDPTLIPKAVEEIVRLESPGFFIGRVLRRDVAMFGVDMKKGERILMALGWANRDARVFANPNSIDLTRSSNRHLAFGYGIHSCVGMHLARMEIRIALEEVLQRMPNYELVEPLPDPYASGGVIWSLDALPIRIPPN